VCLKFQMRKFQFKHEEKSDKTVRPEATKFSSMSTIKPSLIRNEEKRCLRYCAVLLLAAMILFRLFW
jgi:hypothetical protein